MNQNVHKLVLSRFVALYGAPTAPDPQAVIDEYHHALKGYADVALTHGADVAIRENTFRAWPTVGECVKACNTYRAPRAIAHDEDKVFLPPHETGRSEEEREAHIAETMRMIGELKAGVIATNVVGRRT